MNVDITVFVQWISSDFGGRERMPCIGLRPTVRLQRNVESWLKLARDAEITSLEFNSENWTGRATFSLTGLSDEESRLYEQGMRIEFLDAYRVIGVGVILAKQIGKPPW